jgi:hypothetical protein
MAINNPNAWISGACCPVSGAALRPTVVEFVLIILSFLMLLVPACCVVGALGYMPIACPWTFAESPMPGFILTP